MLKTFKLKNGIRVASYSLPNLRSVHLGLTAKSGSIVQDPNQSGVAHLVEHMLVQGTPFLPSAEKFSEFIENMAGTYGAYTQQLLIGFDITLPATHLETAIKIAGEVFFEPSFGKDAVERERQIVIDEVKQISDGQMYKLSKFFRETRFLKGHPLILDPGGAPETIEKLTRDDLIAFWKRYFLPKNTYLVVAGNFKSSQLEKLLDQSFAKYHSKESFPGFPEIDKSDFSGGTVVVRHDPDLKVNYIDLTFPSLTLEDPLSVRMKQDVLLTILGKLRNSRLYKLLRQKEGLVYSVRAGASNLPGLGYVYITSQVSSEYLENVVRLLSSELSDFVKNGPEEEEIRFAKNFLANQWMMTFDHPSSVANWIEGDLLWEKEVILPEEMSRMLSAIKKEDLLEVMQTHWDFSKLNLVVQGPTEDTKSNVDKFSKLIWQMVE